MVSFGFPFKAIHKGGGPLFGDTHLQVYLLDFLLFPGHKHNFEKLLCERDATRSFVRFSGYLFLGFEPPKMVQLPLVPFPTAKNGLPATKSDTLPAPPLPIFAEDPHWGNWLRREDSWKGSAWIRPVETCGFWDLCSRLKLPAFYIGYEPEP